MPSIEKPDDRPIIATYYNLDNTVQRVFTKDGTDSAKPWRFVSYQYDALGNAREIWEGTSASTSSLDLISRMTMQWFDVAGHVTALYKGFGGLGRRTTMEQGFNSSDVSVNSTDLKWDNDPDAQLINGYLPRTGHLRPKTTYLYDLNNNVIGVIDPRGVLTSFAYDALNRRKETIQAAFVPGGVEPPRDPETGRTIKPTTTVIYNAAGQVVEVIDPVGNRTVFEYDLLGRRTAMTEGANSENSRTTFYVYDAADNVLSVTLSQYTAREGSRAVTTAFEYDTLNRKTKMTEAVGASDVTEGPHVTTYVYYVGGQLKNQTTKVNNVVYSTIDYGYDSLGHNTSIIENAGLTTAERRTTLRFNAADNMYEVVDTRGVTTTFAFDAFGRRTAVTGEAPATYLYDAAGNVICKVEAGVTTNYKYDSLNRLVQVATENTIPGELPEYPISYFYDIAGNQDRDPTEILLASGQ